MHEYEKQLEDIKQIRSMMEDSTRFVSLSGLSGIGAGIVALFGAFFTYNYLSSQGIYQWGASVYGNASREQLFELISIALIILLAAIAVSSIFTIRRTRKEGKQIWTRPTQRLLLNLIIPLVAGAIFCVQLAWYGHPGHVAPATLLFYGMALMNAGKYTLREVRYLGISEIGLGLLAGMMPGYGIIFWAIGFGLLHILYGAIMYYKYER